MSITMKDVYKHLESQHDDDLWFYADEPLYAYLVNTLSVGYIAANPSIPKESMPDIIDYDDLTSDLSRWSVDDIVLASRELRDAYNSLAKERGCDLSVDIQPWFFGPDSSTIKDLTDEFGAEDAQLAARYMSDLIYDELTTPGAFGGYDMYTDICDVSDDALYYASEDAWDRFRKRESNMYNRFYDDECDILDD